MPGGAYFQNRVGALKDYFTNAVGRANAGAMAQGEIFNQMSRQASALAYVDVFWILCTAAILMVPLAFPLDKNNPREHEGQVMMD